MMTQAFPEFHLKRTSLDSEPVKLGDRSESLSLLCLSSDSLCIYVHKLICHIFTPISSRYHPQDKFFISHTLYMTEILPIRRKTLYNQSINQRHVTCKSIPIINLSLNCMISQSVRSVSQSVSQSVSKSSFFLSAQLL